MKLKRTIYVKSTSVEQLTKEWGFIPTLPVNDNLFIRCNAEGSINWDKSPVYNERELKSNFQLLN